MYSTSPTLFYTRSAREARGLCQATVRTRKPSTALSSSSWLTTNQKQAFVIVYYLLHTLVLHAPTKLCTALAERAQMTVFEPESYFRTFISLQYSSSIQPLHHRLLSIFQLRLYLIFIFDVCSQRSINQKHASRFRLSFRDRSVSNVW